MIKNIALLTTPFMSTDDVSVSATTTEPFDPPPVPEDSILPLHPPPPPDKETESRLVKQATPPSVASTKGLPKKRVSFAEAQRKKILEEAVKRSVVKEEVTEVQAPERVGRGLRNLEKVSYTVTFGQDVFQCNNVGCNRKFNSAGELSNHVESSHAPLSQSVTGSDGIKSEPQLQPSPANLKRKGGGLGQASTTGRATISIFSVGFLCDKNLIHWHGVQINYHS